MAKSRRSENTEEDVKRAILFSQNLRFILREKSINITNIARKMGVTSAAINSYALGRVFPNEDRIKQLAELIGCSVDDFFDDTSAPWKFGEESK